MTSSDDFTAVFGAAPVDTASTDRIARVKKALANSPGAGSVAPGQIKYHAEVHQGSDAWMELRQGILTASEMKLIITPTLKVAANDKSTAHVYEIAAQRINNYVEPHYISDDMLRGHEDEIDARLQYILNYGAVQEMGFITRDIEGVTIGFSPDGLVGDDGFIECKSRRQKYQLQTLVECVAADTAPNEYMIQIQTGLLVSERKWCDFVTYCGGMEMAVVRVFPDAKTQDAIVAAAVAFESKVQAVIEKYHAIQKSKGRLIPTERRVEQEITL
jgi:hypothetical protein